MAPRPIKKGVKIRQPVGSMPVEALGEGKGFKEFCRRYDELFQKWARGKLEKENPPVPIAAPKPKPMTDNEKKDAHNLIQDLIKGVVK